MTYLQIFADKEELLEPFDDAEKGRLLTAMLAYALHDEEVALTGNERYIWPVFKQMIDQSRDALQKKQKAGNIRAASSTAEQTAAPASTDAAGGSTSAAPDSTAEQTAAPAHIIQESRINNKESRYKNQDNKGVKAASPRFTPPTKCQVDSYCMQNGLNNVDSQRFIDFYTSKGWKVGNTPMKDWQASVRSWNSREDPSKQKPRMVKAQMYPQRNYTEQDLAFGIQDLLKESEKYNDPEYDAS